MRAYALLAAAFVSSFAARAAADITVPGHVETCTMAKQAKAGQECHECNAFHGNHTHCPDSLASYGFTQTCRTNGASVWSEIWCRAASPAAKKVPPEVIGQLSNASSKVRPDPTAASTGTPAATPTAAPTSAPAPTPTAAPAPSDLLAPGPPPVPPQQGCACTTSGDATGPLTAALLAAGAAAVIAVRRRRRR